MNKYIVYKVNSNGNLIELAEIMADGFNRDYSAYTFYRYVKTGWWKKDKILVASFNGYDLFVEDTNNA